MAQFLNWTSPGRIFTSLLQDDDDHIVHLSPDPSKVWNKGEGKRTITILDHREEQMAGTQSEPEDGDTEAKLEQESDATSVQQRLLRAQTVP